MKKTLIIVLVLIYLIGFGIYWGLAPAGSNKLTTALLWPLARLGFK